MDHVTVSPGLLDLPFRDEPVAVTPHMVAALERMRAALISVAQLGGTTTYRALALAVGGAYSPRSLGRPLDVLTIDCRNRGEPSLAALVVRAGRAAEVGRGYVGDPEDERARCYERWLC